MVPTIALCLPANIKSISPAVLRNFLLLQTSIGVLHQSSTLCLLTKSYNSDLKSATFLYENFSCLRLLFETSVNTPVLKESGYPRYVCAVLTTFEFVTG